MSTHQNATVAQTLHSGIYATFEDGETDRVHTVSIPAKNGTEALNKLKDRDLSGTGIPEEAVFIAVVSPGKRKAGVAAEKSIPGYEFSE